MQIQSTELCSIRVSLVSRCIAWARVKWFRSNSKKTYFMMRRDIRSRSRTHTDFEANSIINLSFILKDLHLEQAGAVIRRQKMIAPVNYFEAQRAASHQKISSQSKATLKRCVKGVGQLQYFCISMQRTYTTYNKRLMLLLLGFKSNF